jgi:hypothetical protein
MCSVLAGGLVFSLGQGPAQDKFAAINKAELESGSSLR